MGHIKKPYYAGVPGQTSDHNVRGTNNCMILKVNLGGFPLELLLDDRGTKNK